MISLFYFLLFLLLFWSYAGYILFLVFLTKRKKAEKTKLSPFSPQATIIIPCFNEEKLIKSKIENLLALDYPSRKLDFIFVDGGSTDKTIEIIKATASQNRRIKLVETNLRNKIRQINKILSTVKSEIIIISDVDTQLDIKAVKNMINEFNVGRQVVVVGAYTRPQKVIPLDAIYWQKQNQLRLLENRVFSSSIVIANCYGFRRSLLRQFPVDVVADDIYIAFLAQSRGLRAIYSDKVLALELRAPQKFSEFFYHKFRKAHAYSKEVLRFFPKSTQGSWQWRLVYFTKFLQVIFGPFLVAIFFLLTFRIFLLDKFLLPTIYLLTLFLSITIASQTLKEIGGGEKPIKNIGLTVASFVFVNLILFFALLVYPLYRQTASYRKID